MIKTVTDKVLRGRILVSLFEEVFARFNFIELKEYFLLVREFILNNKTTNDLAFNDSLNNIAFRFPNSCEQRIAFALKNAVVTQRSSLGDRYERAVHWLRKTGQGLKTQANILNDIVHEKIFIDPRWRDKNVFTVLQVIIDDKDYSLFPILGDTLLDAGCNNIEIINHCKSYPLHTEYCWVIDSLLR